MSVLTTGSASHVGLPHGNGRSSQEFPLEAAIVSASALRAERTDRTLFVRCRLLARRLYSGRSAHSSLFLYGLLAFDFISLLFIIATSFLPRSDLTRALDVAFGLAFLAEL